MKEVDLIPDDPKSAESIKQLEQVLSHLLEFSYSIYFPVSFFGLS